MKYTNSFVITRTSLGDGLGRGLPVIVNTACNHSLNGIKYLSEVSLWSREGNLLKVEK